MEKSTKKMKETVEGDKDKGREKVIGRRDPLISNSGSIMLQCVKTPHSNKLMIIR